MERSAAPPTDLEVESTPEFNAALKPVVSAYLDVQEALADDDLARAQSGSEAWLSAIEAATKQAKGQRLREAWAGLARVLEGDVEKFVAAKEIGEARSAFRNLTQSLQRVFATFGNPLGESVRLAYCPMAFDNKGAEWFQRSETVDNAYFGAEMLRCGEIRAELNPGTQTKPPTPKAGPASAPAKGGSQ
jgi:Cu(I)/Ag(I) efflux system membrane fusion protein